jgi:hypothetical protein
VRAERWRNTNRFKRVCGLQCHHFPTRRSSDLLNRFVFFHLSALSLETHLGVTTSPHVPFPTGFVTLPVHSRSPPFRLALFRREKRVVDSSFLRSVRLHSTPTLASVRSSMTPPKARRTIDQIGAAPHLTRAVNHEIPQQIRIDRVSRMRVARLGARGHAFQPITRMSRYTCLRFTA